MPDFAPARGTRIAYEVTGSGPDLVFLHAGIADRSMWQPQIEAFADRFRCTALDLRGFAETPLGDEPYSRRDDVAAVMDAIGARTATLVGCSIGAGIALDFAIERPERVERLILVGVTPAGFEGEDDPLLQELWPQIDDAIEAGDYERAGRLEARLWVDGPGRAEGSAPSWLREQVVEWSIPINSVMAWGDSVQLDPLAMTRLHEVTAPTLVVVGDADAAVVLEGCRQTASGIRGARLVVLAGTAHLPNLEVPPAFNEVVGAFLDHR